MRKLVAERGLTETVRVESAGTGGWHVGEGPDERAAEAARLRGVALCGTARQVRARDFREFDLLVAMDGANRRELLRIAPDDRAAARVRMLREFDPAVVDGELDVPDPYYGGPEGFERVLDIVQRSCLGLLADLGLGEGAAQ